MAHTLGELREAVLSVEQILKETDNGNVLFIGYTGMGKSTAISCMLLDDLHKNCSNGTLEKTVCPRDR
jgi:Tfp pilus assembly pilus retraction ATPase PilT